MAIKEVTPQQAHDILTNDPSAVYIDVRTEGEFANGHPLGAVNIPVAFPDPERGMMVNSDFVRVVEANFPREKKIILGCQAGPRSTSAANMLQQVGFHDVSNLLGGFGGMRDPTGKISAPGWASSGLPVSNHNGEGVSYQSLSTKVR
jgi:rhodanese-related sulfurtransferase